MKRTARIDPDFLILPRAARRLGVDVKRLRLARDRGELVVYKLGNRWQRVAWADVCAWIEQHRVAVSAECRRGGAKA